jgi:ubiquinone/menaquinone biosynthesis C-methylase UbiE
MAFVEPPKTVSHFELEPNMLVADFGCGSGAYTLEMSKAVLPDGKVYTVDVQKDLLIALKNTADDKHITNIEFLWGNLEELGGSKIADHLLDFVLLSNVLFQTNDKGYKLALETKRVLKPEGRVAIIDWTDSFRFLGPHPKQIVTKEEARQAFESAGFVVEKEFVPGDHHYGLIMKKH